MSTRIADGKIIYKCCIQVFSEVLQHALLCMYFTDSASNNAAGALTKSNTLYYVYFLNFFLFSERFLEEEDCFI